MKKKFLSTTILLMAVFSGYYGYKNNHTEGTSDLQLYNIEALALDAEQVTNLCYMYCSYYHDTICYLELSNGTMVYCDEARAWMP